MEALRPLPLFEKVHLYERLGDIEQDRRDPILRPLMVEEEVEGRNRRDLDGNGLNSHLLQEGQNGIDLRLLCKNDHQAEPILLFLQELIIEIGLSLLEGGESGGLVFQDLSQVFAGGGREFEEANHDLFPGDRNRDPVPVDLMSCNERIDEADRLSVPLLLLALGQKRILPGVDEPDFSEGPSEISENEEVLSEIDAEA